MSERYYDEINALQEWFESKLPEYPNIQLRQWEYQQGTDFLPKLFASLLHEVWRWQETRQYEFSYNQVNKAFFAAAEKLGKLTIIP